LVLARALPVDREGSEHAGARVVAERLQEGARGRLVARQVLSCRRAYLSLGTPGVLGGIRGVCARSDGAECVADFLADDRGGESRGVLLSSLHA
ncbi:hypothetical protein PFISCL1PPCAC_451, partial [Pristionchus fissidentatus]